MTKSALWPAAFVVLWSTGFIGARYGLPYAEPMTLLAMRFALAASLLFVAGLAVAGASRRQGGPRPWPSRQDASWQAVVGLLMHGVYLGAVFVSMSLGLEAGAAAVIAGLSPIFTAIGARFFLGEPLGAARIVGMALGFLGVALVVWEKLNAGVGSPLAAAICVLAPIGFAAGAVVQKRRLGRSPMIGGAMAQYLAAALIATPLALTFETNEISWTLEFALALGWLVFGLSFGAIFLLYHLLRRGGAASVSSLTFLVPSSTAFIAWLAFGETLGPTALAGFAVSALGVALVTGALRPRLRALAPPPGSRER